MERREKDAPKALLGLLFYVPMLIAALAINSLAGTGSLFFSIPPLTDGVMDGVLRNKIIKHLGATEKTLTPEDIKTASALYITNSVRGASPVTHLDDIKFPGNSLDASLQIPNDFHLK